MKPFAVTVCIIASQCPSRAFTCTNSKSVLSKNIISNREPYHKLLWCTRKLRVQDEKRNNVELPEHNRFNSKESSTCSRKRIRLHRPLKILLNGKTYHGRKETELKVSTGFTFDDGDQLLVSATKPLGLILEERGIEDGGFYSISSADEQQQKNLPNGCVVAEVQRNSAAERAGVRQGDFLVAVQNADVTVADLEEVMKRINDAPRVVNLRFWRRECEGG